MNTELIAVLVGIVANLLGLAAAATAIAFRMGRFEGKVDERLVAIDETSKELSTEIGRLNETNGGGFARCTQHTEKIMVLERRQTEHVEEMNRRWDAIQERVSHQEP